MDKDILTHKCLNCSEGKRCVMGLERNRRHKRSEVSVYLPQEIVTDIVVRLPVRSLVRFRSVCKSWCSLINNPSFARKNLKHLHSLKDDNDIAFLSSLYHKAYTSYGNCATAIFTSTLKSNDPFVCVNDVNKTPVPPVWKLDCCNKIWGGCDGILCIVLDGGEGVLLWNPSINKYKRLPPPKLDHCSRDVGGIGYDPSVDDYKIFWAHKKYDDLNRNSRRAKKLPVEVFSLKSNSWKTIQGSLPYRTFCGQHSVYTNGGIHLVAKRDNYSKEVAIVCFNVVTEEFEEVQLPCIENMDHITQLLVIGGKLCFANLRGHSSGKIDLWVMNEYGVEESWSKLVTTCSQWSGFGRFKHLSPICFTKIGTVVLQEEGDLKVSIVGFKRPSDETYGSLWTGNVLSSFKEPMFPYVESLISPILSSDN